MNVILSAEKAVRGSVDAILDITVRDSVSHMVDHYGKDEIIFLGPDEQVVPSDCDWICQRAGERNYPTPMAFMSSSPLLALTTVRVRCNFRGSCG